ncbi:MAG: TonB-dependent receptor [Flavobacteriales bacterium]
MNRGLKLYFLLISLVALCVSSAHTQDFTISGTLTDANSGETLIGANIFLSDSQFTTTDVYGFYSITVAKGEYIVEYTYIGYKSVEKQVTLDKDIKINLELSSVSVLEEALVESDKNNNTEGTEMGTISLEVEKIKTLPAFLGEVDILKTIQFLPGVQANGEGNSGFYVRGGGPDQNLILLDNATVYNASHLLGFFSVFNADAVKNIELIKGGIPAQYGGRLSSVLDISLKEGNNKEFHAEGGLGLIASRLTLEGPLKKNKSSFIISGRRTYADVLVKPFAPEGSQARESDYYFYDLNAKLNYKFSDKDQIYLSGYFGKDVFGFVSPDAGFGSDILWGNATGSFRWNHQFGNKLVANTIFTYSNFEFEFVGDQDDFKFSLLSGIKDLTGKVAFSYFPKAGHSIKFGAEFIDHTFTPSSVEASSGETEFDTGGVQEISGREYGIYINDEFSFSDRLKINAGLRFSAFQHVGPFDRFTPISGSLSRDTLSYGKNEIVAQYGGLEPRFSLRYKTGIQSSIKLGVNRNFQYVHLASFSSLTLPTDTWLPTTDRIQPQSGVQSAIGYFRDLDDGNFEASIEAYYKTMNNLVEYKEGARPEDNVNTNIDSQLVFGDGTSYGLEFFLKKNKGDFNGWIGYTWSKTDRLFEDLNSGISFPAKYDRRHDFSAVANYERSKTWTFSGAFVYSSGNAFTPPVSWYVLEGRTVFEYAERNSFRLPDFHRLDLSATRYSEKFNYSTLEDGSVLKTPKKIQSSWTFSIYNVYNRRNPFFIYYVNSGNLQAGEVQISARQVSLFPVLPSVTWNFKF